jgi:hypothetical protein
VASARHINGDAAAGRQPFFFRWADPDNPLPVKAIRAPARLTSRKVDFSPRERKPPLAGREVSIPTGLEGPPWLSTGPTGEPFDFCASVRRLCADLVARCEPLRHIDVSRLLFAVTQARSGRPHGLQARVTPLRFRDGHLTRQRRGVTYQVQRYFWDSHEFLYLVTFCLPRFLDQDFDDKFITLFHELFHISPEFNGDLRRHTGRYALHSHSQRLYDKHMAGLARTYLAGNPNPELHAFLRLNFAQLQHRHGSVVGVMVPRPKLIPLPGASHVRTKPD